jgi:DNA anti-recombination protein RmuC
VWEFLGEVLEKHGLAAIVILAALGGCGYLIYHLFRRNKDLTDKLVGDSKAHEVSTKHAEVEHQKALRKVIEAYEGKLRDNQEGFARRLAAVQEKCSEEAQNYSKKLDDLHEKRLNEMKEVVTEVVTSASKSNAAVERISLTMDLFKDMMTGRR